MARPLRLNLAGGWYHVTARGNEHRAIYRDERDRQHFLELVSALPDRFQVRVHAYVLLDNHYHLQLETLLANLSQAVQWLNVSYSVWFNRRHRRSGHLFQGRFHAVITDTEMWVLEVSRYLHLNPVRVAAHGLDKPGQNQARAGLRAPPSPAEIQCQLKQLRQYPWSSYRVYSGAERAPEWLTWQVVGCQCGGRTVKEQQRRYRQFVETSLREGMPERPWEQLAAGMILGSRQFVLRLAESWRGDAREQPEAKAFRRRPNFAMIRQVVEKLKGESWEAFRDRHGDWGRDLAVYLARQRGGMRLKELGAAIGGMDYASVSVTIKRFGQRAQTDRQVAQALRQAEQLLNDKM